MQFSCLLPEERNAKTAKDAKKRGCNLVRRLNSYSAPQSVR